MAAVKGTAVEVNGFAVRAIRTAKGITAQAMAEATGYDRTYFVKIEGGRWTSLSAPAFDAIVSALDLNDPRAIIANPNAGVAA